MSKLKKLYISFFSLLFACNLSAQHFVSKTLLHTFSKHELDSTLDANGIPSAIAGTKWGVDAYKVIYNTVSFDSTATTASGLMIVPKLPGCSFPIAMYAHGTVLSKEQAPSRLQGIEPYIGLVISSSGYVSILPDYLGLGDGPGLHPYQHKHSEATAIIDFIRATKENLSSMNVTHNSQLFLTGYSQGGHAAMAAQEWIQNHLQGEMTVTASVPMSGAYDMSGTMADLMLLDSVYPEPAYLPYIVFGWNQIYHFFTNPSEILASPWDTVLPPLYDGTHDFGVVGQIAPSVPKTIFRPGQIDSFIIDPNYFFRVALRENDAYHFTPTAPTKMMYCKGDTRVPYLNALVAKAYFDSTGCVNCQEFDVDSTLDHQPCAQYAVLYAKGFFETFAIHDSCEAMTLEEITGGWEVGYDFLGDNLVINATTSNYKGGSINILTAEGKLVSSFKTKPGNGKQSFSMANLVAGLYIVQMEAAEKRFRVKKFVKVN